MRGWVLGLLALTGLVVVMAAIAGWIVWRHPLAVDARLSRWALARAGFEKRNLQGPNGRLIVWEGGAGPTLVLLHGAGDQAGSWSKVAPALAERLRVVIPDLPGHGGSGPAAGPLTLEMELRGVEAVLAVFTGGKPAVLVGNSLGAWVAALVAVDHPSWVSRLVLVDGGPVRGDPHAPSLQPANRAQARRLMETLMGPDGKLIPGFVLDDVVRRARVGPIARLVESADEMKRFLLDGRLSEVQAPVDLLWGEADGLFPIAYAQRLEAGLPAARLTTIAGCGHVPQRQCPRRFGEALAKILESAPPAARAGDGMGAVDASR